MIKLNQKGILYKILIILLMIILLNSAFPLNKAFALGEKETVGGKLLKPVADLLLAFGDGILNIVHNAIYQMNTSVIRINLDDTLTKILLSAAAFLIVGVIVGVLLIAVSSAAAVASAAIAAVMGTAATTVTTIGVGVIATISVASGVAAVVVVNSNCFRKRSSFTNL